jgi:geranylgeranyl pyrophosphate synthase
MENATVVNNIKTHSTRDAYLKTDPNLLSETEDELNKKELEGGIHPERLREMKEIRKDIRKEFARFKKNYSPKNAPLYTIMESRFRGDSNLPLRAYFTKKVTDYLLNETSICPNEKDIFYIRLPFVIETVICIQYYHNQILDGKSGVTHADAINDNLLMGNLLKDQLYRYIRDNFGRHTNLVEIYVMEMFEWVDYGQLVEQKFNKYTNFKTERYPKNILDEKYWMPKYLEDRIMKIVKCPKEKKTFLKWYYQRIYLTSGGLFKLTAELVGTMLGLKEQQYKGMIKFSVFYGMMLQIVNDNADFIPSKYKATTSVKNATDNFSDLRNNNITLPVFLYLTENQKGAIFQFLEKESCNTSTKMEEQLFKDIVKSKAIFNSIGVGRVFTRLASSCLDHRNKHNWAFQDMTQISRNNRFYHYYFQPIKPAYETVDTTAKSMLNLIITFHNYLKKFFEFKEGVRTLSVYYL